MRKNNKCQLPKLLLNPYLRANSHEHLNILKKMNKNIFLLKQNKMKYTIIIKIIYQMKKYNSNYRPK